MPIVPAMRSVRPVERLFRLGGEIYPSPMPIVPAVRSVRPVERLFRLGEC